MQRISEIRPRSLNALHDRFEGAHHSFYRLDVKDLVSTYDPAIMSVMGADTLNQIFHELKSRNKETRLRGSYELLNHVNSAHRGELSQTDHERY